MNIYEKLGFTADEIDNILLFIRNDDYDVYGEAKQGLLALQQYRKNADQAIECLDKLINAEVPNFYQRQAGPVAEKLLPALESLQRLPPVNYLHEGQNFPTKGKDRLTRAYHFLKRRYESKTGRVAGVTNDPISFQRTGDFIEFVRQVSSDIDERWIRSLVSHSASQLSKANKNKT